MKKLAVILTLCSVSVAFSGQKQKAEQILVKTEAALRNLKIFRAVFELRNQNKEANLDDRREGLFAANGIKYHLTLSNSKVICDGKNIYTYLVDTEEVTITDTSMVDNLSNPRELLKVSKLGKNPTVISETATTVVLKMAPAKSSDEMESVYATIDKATYLPQHVKIITAEGTELSIKVKSIKKQKSIDDKLFRWDKEAYPNVMVNDLR